MDIFKQKRIKELLEIAKNNQYAPYSNFRVACSVVITDLVAYEGVNIENASYGLTMCAERVAIYQAIMWCNIKHEKVKEILIVSPDGMPRPCGSCLQVMSEFCSVYTPITISDGKSEESFYLGNLLPYPFEVPKK